MWQWVGWDDLGPLLMLVCSDSMESQCWGTDGPFAEVRTGQGDGQAKDQGWEQSRGTEGRSWIFLIEGFSKWVTYFLP